jgi:hypothetical protein
MLSVDLRKIVPVVEVRFLETVKEVLTMLKSVPACMAALTVVPAAVIETPPLAVRVPVPE